MKLRKKYLSLDINLLQENMFIRSADEVLILPLDGDDAIFFAAEPSPAFDENVLILPGGSIKPGEKPIETANRELQEELGFRAQRLDYLGKVRPWPKYLSVEAHIYLGRELIPSRLIGDEPYPIEVVRVTWEEIDYYISNGQLCDARAVAGVYLARIALNPKHNP